MEAVLLNEVTIVDRTRQLEEGTCCRSFSATGIDEGLPVGCYGLLGVLSRPSTPPTCADVKDVRCEAE
jgi:hypothetical protein